MTKKKNICYIHRIKDIFIPDSQVQLFFARKKDFLQWFGGGCVYVTDKPDKDGYYTFYGFDDGRLCAVYKQKSDKL